jgi:hypothetical protein
MQARAQPQVVVADPPKTKRVTMKIGGRTAEAVITEEA